MERVIFLVHGTFARDAGWTRSNSPLCESLLRANSATRFERFEWSGRNSHRARLDAGRQLAAVLRSSVDSHPNIAHLIIGHSHGGNVALYALRDAELQARVAGVITLATPFMTARPRDVRFGVSLTVLGVILCSPVLLSLILSRGYQGGDFWATVGLGAVAFALLSFRYVAQGLDSVVFKRLMSDVLRVLTQGQRNAVQRLAAPQTSTPLVAMLVQRDEADRWLRFTEALGDLPYRILPAAMIGLVGIALGVLVAGLLSFLSVPMDAGDALKSFVMVASGCVIVYFTLANALKDVAGRSIKILAAVAGATAIAGCAMEFVAGVDAMQALAILWALSGLGLVAMHALLIVAPTLFRGHPLAYGWERIGDNWLARIVTAPVPYNFECTRLEYPFTGHGLRHCAIYDLSDVLRDLASSVDELASRWIGLCRGAHSAPAAPRPN